MTFGLSARSALRSVLNAVRRVPQTVPVVFLETSVLKHAVRRTEWVANKQELRWGPLDLELDVHSPSSRPPEFNLRGGDQERLREEIRCLPKVAAGAARGRLRLVIQNEVEWELWTVKNSRDQAGLFFGVSIDRIDAPLEYSRVIVGGSESAEEHQRCFLEGVDDPLYQDLRKALGATDPRAGNRFNQLKDAWHLLCAEHAKCDLFLTTDFKLIRMVRAWKKNPLRVRLVTPSELLAELGAG